MVEDDEKAEVYIDETEDGWQVVNRRKPKKEKIEKQSQGPDVNNYYGKPTIRRNPRYTREWIEKKKPDNISTGD